LANRIKQRYFWEVNDEERVGYFIQLVQGVFFLSLLYLMMIMAIIMYRVFADQIVIKNGIFPILDVNKVKLKANQDLSKTDQV